MMLAGNAQCQQCVVKQLFRYMAGRHEGPGDKPVLERAYEEFRASGFQFQELLVALTKWSAYLPERQN